ncbi:MAG: M1 family metallopeptidase [Candidatus Heimdallarchaeota archaeon]|nr:M1 family metallopeptidase [Candidatus Heimdallarchaeota archaeon]
MVELTPNHYNLLIEPDLESFRFKGKTEINISSNEPIAEFNLHSLDLEIIDCTIASNGTTQKVNWNIDLKSQTLQLDFEEKVQEFTLKVDYIGEINEHLMGFYRSRYKVNGEERWAGVTQFEESDARRAFPCFDVPGKKATFDVSFIIDQHLIGISNGHIESETELENNKKKIVFAKTPVMSTYLLFFGVGEFNKIVKKTRGYDVSVIASPEHTPLSTYGDFALDFAVKTLEYCEDYFDVKYPFKKLDNIATADFFHGAMENYGAILYRENLLLRFPGVTNYRSETYILEVIAHEITHQWFGNLVSPINWKYLWLNESFATFFGYGIVDHYYPEKKVWEEYVRVQTEVALNNDGRIQTLPIERTGGGAVGMTVKNASILYNKGGSVLRQLKNYLGENEFRDGLRYFLNKFAYSNARSDDLWASLEEASGKPISKFMESWILQDGYPLITVTQNENQLSLNQRRFTYLNRDSDARWLIPISIVYYFDDGRTKIETHLMERMDLTIEIPSNVRAYKLNNEMEGFYRTLYPANNLEELLKLVKEDKMSSIDKYSLEIDMYALLKATRISIEEYLDFISNYIGLLSPLSVSSITSHLQALYSQGNEATKILVSKVGKEFLETILTTISLEPQEGEDHEISTLRGDLLSNAVRFGSEIVTDFVMKQFTIFKEGGQIPPDILTAILVIAARLTDDIDWFVQRYETAENEELSVKLITALGQFTKMEHIEKMQAYTFEKIPGRNRRILIQSLANNAIAKHTLWYWYLANLDNFEKLHEYSYQIAIVQIVNESSEYYQDVHKFFDDYVKKNPHVSDAVDVAMENLEIIKNFTLHINN